MSNAILRVLVCVSFLVMGTFAAALPPPGTPPPPPPPPPPPVVVQPAAPPVLRVPTATNAVFWIQCPPNVYLPNNAPTAPAVSYLDLVEPAGRLPNGTLVPSTKPSHFNVTRYPDAFSSQFAALVNRVPAGCTLNVLPAVDPRYQYDLGVLSDLQLVKIINAIDPKTQRQTETLVFSYFSSAAKDMPANGGLCGAGANPADAGYAVQTTSCAFGKMCIKPNQQNFCLWGG